MNSYSVTAARDFLTQYWYHAGFLLPVPAHTTVPVLVHRLAPSGIASGLVQLALVEGDRLTLQVIARMDGDLEPPPDSYLPNADRIHQRGTFDRPDIVRSLDFTVGGPPVMMVLGSDQCVFRGNSSTRSNPNRPLIPGQIVH